MSLLRIRYRPTGDILAEGPKGWGVTPFEGNYYVRRKYLKTPHLKANLIPGICVYKFFYVWMDLHLDGNSIVKNIAWKYWLPNPLLPFIWWRVALPGNHCDIEIVEINPE